MAVAGYVVEAAFGALSFIPTNRAVGVITQGPSLNYTSALNVLFLALAAIMVVRFLRTGGPAMLHMMSAPTGDIDAHDHGDHAAMDHGAHAGHATPAHDAATSATYTAGDDTRGGRD